MDPDPAAPPAADEFVAAIAATMGIDVGAPGTTVLPSPRRADSAVALAYAFASHTVLWCDPALAADLDPLADRTVSLSLSAFDTWATAMGWTPFGHSAMHLLPASGVRRRDRVPSAVADRFRSVDAADPVDRALIEAFVQTLPEDDREEADLDGDEFDDHITVIVDDHGIAAYASQKPFDHAVRFGDIAVATRPDRRGQGLGTAVVARLCDEIAAVGLVPLYRRDPRNDGSVGLCAALGFVPVVEFSGFERPPSA